MATLKMPLPPMVRPTFVLESNGITPPWAYPSHDSKLPVRRTRTSRPKVKTGCITCKVRRVKCDETKPDCQRCTSTGRTCDGYTEAPKAQQRKPKSEAVTSLLLCRSPDSHYGTPEETRALEFFYKNTAPQLASYFDADFWTRLIFQMCHAESAIRHAMIALGTLSERHAEDPRRVPLIPGLVQREEAEELPNPTRMNLPLIQPKRETEATFALMHYNKAIMNLAARVQSNDVPIETVLLACILFVCLEFMRGDVQPALKHFKSGMGVALASLTDSNSLTRTAAQRIRQNMLPFFNRLELLSTVLGHPVDWEYGITLKDSVPSNFSNLRQARDSLVHVQNYGIRFVRANGLRRYQNLDLFEEHVEQRSLLNALEKWKQTFEDLLLSENFGAIELDGAKVLRIHHLVAQIWIGIALRGDECKNDEWNDEWDLLVSLAEAVQRSSQNTAGYLGQVHGSRFLFDMEIVSGLWLVITKCRHPLIRRRASAILKTTARQEGLYDAQLAGTIGDCLMAIEERSLTTLDGTELPPEYDRIHHTVVTLGAPKPGLDTYYLTHYYRPFGLDGSLEALHEEVHLAQESSP